MKQLPKGSEDRQEKAEGSLHGHDTAQVGVELKVELRLEPAKGGAQGWSKHGMELKLD